MSTATDALNAHFEATESPADQDDPSTTAAEDVTDVDGEPESEPATTGGSISYRTAQTYVLTGRAGYALNRALMFAIELGMQAERIKAGSGYRLMGEAKSYRGVRTWIAHTVSEGATCEVEKPPAGPLVEFKLAPTRPSARSTILHGTSSAWEVARAIDMGLSVRVIGLMRFEIRGSTKTQADWLAAGMRSTLDEALRAMNLTRATAAAEDSAAPELPPISIHLPTRETTSDITRDRAGFITSIVQTEISAS